MLRDALPAIRVRVVSKMQRRDATEAPCDTPTAGTRTYGSADNAMVRAKNTIPTYVKEPCYVRRTKSSRAEQQTFISIHVSSTCGPGAGSEDAPGRHRMRYTRCTGGKLRQHWCRPAQLQHQAKELSVNEFAGFQIEAYHQSASQRRVDTACVFPLVGSSSTLAQGTDHAFRLCVFTCGI